MASTTMGKEGARTTRRSTTRASISARSQPAIQDGDREDKHPSLEIRSREMSSSTMSSLSPSPQKLALRPIVQIPAAIPVRNTSAPKPSRVSRDKGKGKALEPPVPTQGEQGRPGKRVLPARIRRAAGGGQEGFRDLEDMIVDWLDRYGYPNDSPPDSLRITITSLPLELVDPPVISEKQEVATEQVTTEQVTITPNEAGPSTGRGMIETPDWIKVTSGQDDEEEAREELLVTRNPVSPLRRLRRLSASNEASEDVSDEYYHRLHKRYEAIEKRQRKDERDKITHERYRMRTRIDLLRSISSGSWSSVVWTVLAREDPTGLWDKGKQAVKVNGIEWLRRRLVKEGEEVMKRYDSMLPVDPRKSKIRDEKTRSYMSESPPPTALPARVAALKLKEASDRRKSLPAPQPSQSPISRKRRQSESSTARPMRKPRQAHVNESTITVQSEDEVVSDTDSDPLSDPPSESDEDVGQSVEGGPSPSPSFGSVISASVPAVQAQATRTGRPPPRKRPSPSRTTIRKRLPVAPPLPLPAPAPESEQAISDTTHEKWSDFDVKHSDPPANPAYQVQGQIQDQVTLDEQLDLERVEAAVVI